MKNLIHWKNGLETQAVWEGEEVVERETMREAPVMVNDQREGGSGFCRIFELSVSTGPEYMQSNHSKRAAKLDNDWNICAEIVKGGLWSNGDEKKLTVCTEFLCDKHKRESGWVIISVKSLSKRLGSILFLYNKTCSSRKTVKETTINLWTVGDNGIIKQWQWWQWSQWGKDKKYTVGDDNGEHLKRSTLLKKKNAV